MRRDTEAETFARMLHASNAWHCGCDRCAKQRAEAEGRKHRKVIPGPWPMRVESWLPTEAERRSLLGEDE